MFITALTLYLLSGFYHLKDCRFSAMPTHFSFHNSHTSGRSVLCPHRNRTVIFVTEISRFLRNLEVSLSRICFIAPHTCCAFCQVFLAPCLYFNALFGISSCSLRQWSGAGISWRTSIVATHILMSCMWYNIQFLSALSIRPKAYKNNMPTQRL